MGCVVVSGFALGQLLFSAFAWAALAAKWYHVYASCLVVGTAANLIMWVFVYMKYPEVGGMPPPPRGEDGVAAACRGCRVLAEGFCAPGWKCPTAWYYGALLLTILVAGFCHVDGPWGHCL